MIVIGMVFADPRSLLKRNAEPQISFPLVVPSTELDIGEIWNLRHFHKPLPITNESDQALSCQIASGCSCTSLVPSEFEIRPHESKTVFVNLKLPVVAPDKPMPVDVQLFVKTSLAPDSQTVWNLTGMCHSQFVVTPSDIKFADLRVNSTNSNPISLKIESVEPIVNWDVSASNGFVAVDRKTTESSATELQALIKPTAAAIGSAGESDDLLQFSATTSQGRKLASLDVPIHLSVRHDVEVDQRVLLLGQHEVGTVAQAKFKVLSSRGAPFRVELLASDASDLTVSESGAANLTSGSSEYSVRYVIRTLGSHHGNIRLTIQDKVEAKLYSIEIPVIAIGI
jgi:hypothetical protein